jgi:hypothetical protein
VPPGGATYSGTSAPQSAYDCGRQKHHEIWILKNLATFFAFPEPAEVPLGEGLAPWARNTRVSTSAVFFLFPLF